MLVVKCGGAAGVEVAAVCEDVANLVRSGRKVILVHGGSDEANRLGEALGHPPRFLTSISGVRSRYTDSLTLEIITMAMAGRVNPRVVSHLNQLGVHAIGLSGLDGCLLKAKRKPAVKAVEDGRVRMVRDDLTGRIITVNTSLLHSLMDQGYVPVVSPPALDPLEGPVNVDADRTAAAIAGAMKAECLVILSNVPGLLQDPDDPDSLLPTAPPGGMEECMNLAKGRMKLKLLASFEALRSGVQRVILGDGRLRFPVQQALVGRGTVLDPSVLREGVPV